MTNELVRNTPASPRSAIKTTSILAAASGAGAPAQGENYACVTGAYVSLDAAATHKVRIGGPEVTSALGLELSAGDVVFFPVQNLNQIYAYSEDNVAQTANITAL